MQFKRYIPFLIFISVIALLAWNIHSNKNINQQIFNLNEVEIILGDEQLKYNNDFMFVYIFSPKCQRCQESFAKIRELKTLGKKLLAVVIDEDKSEVEAMPCWRDGLFDAVGSIPNEQAYFFDINQLPDLLLIKNHGDIVLRNKVEISQEFDIDNLKMIIADAAKN